MGLEGSTGLAAEEQRYRALLDVDVSAPGALEALTAGLHDASWRVRKAAAEQLARVPTPDEVVSRLVDILGERDETGARNAAVEALSRLGEAAAPAMIDLLRHPDPDQRKLAADILGQMESRQGEEPLVAALDDADLNVRVSAAEALARVGGEAAGRALERLLKQPEPLLRLCALEGLAQLRRAPPMPEVVPLLSDRKLQRSAYRVLGLIPQPAALELICKGLLSEPRATREAALSALGMQWLTTDAARRGELENAVRASARKVPGLHQLLLSALFSDDSEVRAGALFLAGALRDVQLAVAVAEVASDDRLAREVRTVLLKLGAQAGRMLLPELGNLSGPARAAAIEALGEMVEPSWIEPLVELAGSGEPELQLFALRALGRSQSERAVAPLLGFLDEPSLALAAARALVALAGSHPAEVLSGIESTVAGAPTPAGILALARVGGAAALPTLRKALREPEPLVRAAAADAAALVGGEECLELARLALLDEVPRVRAAAARALGKLALPGSAVLLEHALSDEDAAVQAEAIEAAGECGATELVPIIVKLVCRPDPLLAIRAVRALGRLGGISPDAMRVAARHPDPEVIKEALIGGTPLPESVAVAAELLAHPRWDVRAAAARVLGASGGAGSLVEVRAALAREQDPLAREVLADAAARLAER